MATKRRKIVLDAIRLNAIKLGIDSSVALVAFFLWWLAKMRGVMTSFRMELSPFMYYMISVHVAATIVCVLIWRKLDKCVGKEGKDRCTKCTSTTPKWRDWEVLVLTLSADLVTVIAAVLVIVAFRYVVWRDKHFVSVKQLFFWSLAFGGILLTGRGILEASKVLFDYESKLVRRLNYKQGKKMLECLGSLVSQREGTCEIPDLNGVDVSNEFTIPHTLAKLYVLQSQIDTIHISISAFVLAFVWFVYGVLKRDREDATIQMSEIVSLSNNDNTEEDDDDDNDDEVSILELGDATTRRDELMMEKRTNDTKLQELQNDPENNADDIRKLETDKKRLESNITEAEEEIDAKKKGMNKESIDKAEFLVSNVSEISEIDNEIDEKRMQLESNEDDLEKVNKELSKETRELSDTESRMEKLDNDLRDIDNKVKEMQLNKSNTGQSPKVLSELLKEQEHLTKSKGKLESDINVLNNSINDKQSRKTETEKSLHDAKTALEETENRRKEKESESSKTLESKGIGETLRKWVNNKKQEAAESINEKRGEREARREEAKLKELKDDLAKLQTMEIDDDTKSKLRTELEGRIEKSEKSKIEADNKAKKAKESKEARKAKAATEKIKRVEARDARKKAKEDRQAAEKKANEEAKDAKKKESDDKKKIRDAKKELDKDKNPIKKLLRRRKGIS